MCFWKGNSGKLYLKAHSIILYLELLLNTLLLQWQKPLHTSFEARCAQCSFSWRTTHSYEATFLPQDAWKDKEKEKPKTLKDVPRHMRSLLFFFSLLCSASETWDLRTTTIHPFLPSLAVKFYNLPHPGLVTTAMKAASRHHLPQLHNHVSKGRCLVS